MSKKSDEDTGGVPVVIPTELPEGVPGGNEIPVQIPGTNDPASSDAGSSTGQKAATQKKES